MEILLNALDSVESNLISHIKDQCNDARIYIKTLKDIEMYDENRISDAIYETTQRTDFHLTMECVFKEQLEKKYCDIIHKDFNTDEIREILCGYFIPDLAMNILSFVYYKFYFMKFEDKDFIGKNCKHTKEYKKFIKERECNEE